MKPSGDLQVTTMYDFIGQAKAPLPEFEFTPTRPGDDWAGFGDSAPDRNAPQSVPSNIPAPAAALLLGLPGAALLRRRR